MIYFFTILSFLISGLLPATESLDKTAVIVDTDMGKDDIMAFLSLLKKPNIDVKAITVTGTGLAHAAEGHRNLRCLLRFLNKSEIPTAVGRDTASEGGHFFPESWRRSTDAVFDHTMLEHENGNFSPKCDAIELLRATMESSPKKISIIALGPLTNIAEVFQKYPKLIHKVERIHIMGGAVNASGNLHVIEENTVAEWNIFADPSAAQQVFKLGIPINLIALDVTNQVPLTRDFYEYVEKNGKTPAATLLYQIMTGCMPRFNSVGGYYFWDPLAVEVFVDPTLVSYESYTLDIITNEGSQCGKTECSDSGDHVQLATKIDRERFLQIYFDTVNSD